MTRLAVWYVRILLERGDVRPDDLPIALCKRVDLYRLTNFWNGTLDTNDGLTDPEWRPLATEIAAWIRSTPMCEVDRLEQHVLAFLEPSIEERLPKDVGPPPVRPFECWTYELGWPGLADGAGLWGKLSNPVHLESIMRKGLGLRPRPSRDGVLHIMNVVVPRSPFDEMPRLAATLQALIAELRSHHPQVRKLWCNTWLNDHARFRVLFPQRWFDNARVAPHGNYRNWWGQFARRDGDFNEAAAQRFRKSGGTFPYRALQCHASLSEIEAHLERSFGHTANPATVNRGR
ncbi:MAG: hypothetical protein ACRYFU_03730 [Janthinobacterium lividum]